MEKIFEKTYILNNTENQYRNKEKHLCGNWDKLIQSSGAEFLFRSFKRLMVITKSFLTTSFLATKCGTMGVITQNEKQLGSWVIIVEKRNFNKVF